MSTDIPSGSQQENRRPLQGLKETPAQHGVKQTQISSQLGEKLTSEAQTIAPEASAKPTKPDVQVLAVKVIVKPADMKVLNLEPGAKYEAKVLSPPPPIKHDATSQSRAAQSMHLMIRDREITVKVQTSTSHSDSSPKVEFPLAGQKIKVEISKQSPAEHLSEYSSVIGKNSDKVLQPIGDILKVLSSINAVPDSTKNAIQESLQALIKHVFNQGKNQSQVLDPELVKSTPPQLKDQSSISKNATIATNLQQKVKAAIEEAGVLQQYAKHEKPSVTQWQNLETKLNQLAKQIATEIYTKPQQTIPKDRLEQSRQIPQIKENQASKIDQQVQQTASVKNNATAVAEGTLRSQALKIVTDFQTRLHSASQVGLQSKAQIQGLIDKVVVEEKKLNVASQTEKTSSASITNDSSAKPEKSLIVKLAQLIEKAERSGLGERQSQKLAKEIRALISSQAQVSQNPARNNSPGLENTPKGQTDNKTSQQALIAAEKVAHTKPDTQGAQQSNKAINTALATQLNTIRAKTHTLEKDVQQALTKSIERVRAANSIQMSDLLSREGKNSAVEENNKTLKNIEQSIKVSALAVKQTDTRSEVKLSETQHKQWRVLSKQIGDFSRQLHILDTPETINKKLQSIKIALGESTRKDNIIKTDERSQEALKRVLYQSSSSSNKTTTNRSSTESQVSVSQASNTAIASSQGKHNSAALESRPSENTNASLDAPSTQRIKSSVQLFNKSSDALVNMLFKEHSLAATTTESIKQSLLVLKLASETLLSNTDMPAQKVVPKEVLDKNISLLENAQRAMVADKAGTVEERPKQWIRLAEQLASISKQVVLPTNNQPNSETVINRLLANQIYQNLDISKFNLRAGSASLLDEDFLHKPVVSDTNAKPLTASTESLKQPKPTTGMTESDRRQLNAEPLRTPKFPDNKARPTNDAQQPQRPDQNTKAADAGREVKSERVALNKPSESVNNLRAGLYREVEKSFSEVLNKPDKHITSPDKTEAKTHQAGPLVTQKNIAQLGLTQNELYQAKVLSITRAPISSMHHKPDATASMGVDKGAHQAILQLAGKTVLVQMPFELKIGQLIPVKMTEQHQLIIPNSPINALATVLKSLGAVMPAQQNLAKVLDIFTHSSIEKMPLSAPAKTLITQLMASLPRAQDFTVPSSDSKAFTENHLAVAIKHAMQTSGVFSEQRQMALVEQQQGGRVQAVLSQHSPQVEGGKKSSMLKPSTSSIPSKAVPTDSVKTASQPIVNMSTRSVPPKVSVLSAPPPAIADQEQLLLQEDLKVQISKLIAALKTQQDPNGGDGKLLSGISPLSDPTIMNNPLHFPQLNVSHMAHKEGNYEEGNIGLILRLLAGALNRIQFHQLSSLHRSMTESTEQSTLKSIQMEIPMLGMNDNIDPFQLRIDHSLAEKEKDDNEQNMQKQWTVNLAFDLEKLGPMYVQVKLIEQTVSTHIWAEQDKALRLIQSESDYFRETLRKQGIEVGDIQYQKGNPNVTKTKIEQHMVNTNA